MGELANYTIDQVAGALALTLGSVGGLCLILFKSRCQRISICWGIWSCDRKVAEEDQEEVKDKPVAGKTEEEAIVPPVLPTSSLASNPGQIQVPELPQVNP
tara:strand:+ start:221 stop:523 length:303 start_codon:yes stop_codon:yes gene_type:complete